MTAVERALRRCKHDCERCGNSGFTGAHDYGGVCDDCGGQSAQHDQGKCLREEKALKVSADPPMWMGMNTKSSRGARHAARLAALEARFTAAELAAIRAQARQAAAEAAAEG